jgi:hypothetical protein
MSLFLQIYLIGAFVFFLVGILSYAIIAVSNDPRAVELTKRIESDRFRFTTFPIFMGVFWPAFLVLMVLP